MNKCSNPQCGCDACDCGENCTCTFEHKCHENCHCGDTKFKKENTEVDNCTCENECHCSKNHNTKKK